MRLYQHWSLGVASYVCVTIHAMKFCPPVTFWIQLFTCQYTAQSADDSWSLHHDLKCVYDTINLHSKTLNTETESTAASWCPGERNEHWSRLSVSSDLLEQVKFRITSYFKCVEAARSTGSLCRLSDLSRQTIKCQQAGSPQSQGFNIQLSIKGLCCRLTQLTEVNSVIWLIRKC